MSDTGHRRVNMQRFFTDVVHECVNEHAEATRWIIESTIEVLRRRTRS
jgi:Leu/Phe-tRNA-protein transferase